MDKDANRHFVNGFFYAFNVIKAAGHDVSPLKLESTLKEIAAGDTTIATTPTDHLLWMEKAMGKPLTEQQKAAYLQMIGSVSKQDDGNKKAANLILEIIRGNLRSIFD